MTTMKLLDDEPRDSSSEHVLQYLKALEEADKDGFTELADFTALPDGARVRMDSETWARRFLTDAANPFRPDLHARRSIHRSCNGLPDVLRHEYAIALARGLDPRPVKVHMTVDETVGWLRIEARPADFDLAKLSADQRAPAIAWLAEHVLRLRGDHRTHQQEDARYAWEFLYRTLDEGTRFSTDPGQLVVTMWSWADRVDGGIQHGQVYFLGFKQRAPVNGKLVRLNPDHWFDGKCWDTYRPG
jgi:hypothetical protein